LNGAREIYRGELEKGKWNRWNNEGLELGKSEWNCERDLKVEGKRDGRKWKGERLW
jgi:hypothetical protein